MKFVGQFLIGLYLGIYGISLLTDPWTQLHYDRSIRQIGMKNGNEYAGQLLKFRSLYGFAHIFCGYCLMNRISQMKIFISSIIVLDIFMQTAFTQLHLIFQDVILIGVVNFI